MAVKYSSYSGGKTVIIASQGTRKAKRTFDSRKEAIDWYNNTFLNGANR